MAEGPRENCWMFSRPAMTSACRHQSRMSPTPSSLNPLRAASAECSYWPKKDASVKCRQLPTISQMKAPDYNRFPPKTASLLSATLKAQFCSSGSFAFPDKIATLRDSAGPFSARGVSNEQRLRFQINLRPASVIQSSIVGLPEI